MGWIPKPLTDHGGLTGLADDDHPQYLLGTDGGKGTVNTVAASGATETLDLAAGNFHDVTLDADCTLTLTGATAGVECYMTILLRQDGTGSRTVTWPASVEWVGGSAPTLQTAASAWDIVVLVTVDGGTTWFAQHAGTGSGASAFDDLSDVDTTGVADGQGVFYRGSTSQWENARSPEPLTDETGTILTLEDDSVAMSEPFFD